MSNSRLQNRSVLAAWVPCDKVKAAERVLVVTSEGTRDHFHTTRLPMVTDCHCTYHTTTPTRYAGFEIHMALNNIEASYESTHSSLKKLACLA